MTNQEIAIALRRLAMASPFTPPPEKPTLVLRFDQQRYTCPNSYKHIRHLAQRIEHANHSQLTALQLRPYDAPYGGRP